MAEKSKMTHRPALPCPIDEFVEFTVHEQINQFRVLGINRNDAYYSIAGYYPGWQVLWVNLEYLLEYEFRELHGLKLPPEEKHYDC